MTPQTAIENAARSTIALAQMYEEKATVALLLGKMAGPITITPDACRSLALLLRNHVEMLLDTNKALHIQQVCADARLEQLVRALALVDRVKSLGFFGMVMFWRQMRADPD